MVWDLSVMSILGIVAALISGLLALYSLRHRGKRMALQFTILEVTLMAWTIAYAIQLGFETLANQLFWQRLTLGIAGFIPTVFLLFTLAYASHETWLSRERVALLVAEPVVWFLLCMSNPVHELIWMDAELTATFLVSVTALKFGVGYIIHITYAYAIVTIGIALLLQHATRVAPIYQKQVGLLVLGVVPPFFSHILYSLGLSPIPELDLTPFVFAFTGIVFGLALFKFDLLHVTPMAREQAFYEAGDGLLLLNNAGEIIDVIGVAGEILTPTPRIGAAFEDVFPQTGLDTLHDSEFAAFINGERRVYQFQVSPVAADLDQQVGTLVLMQDITGLFETQQRLSVSNRVLRHNLRNDMTIILGYADILESNLDGEDATHAQLLRERAEHLLELANKAQQIANLHSDTTEEGTTIDLASHLHEVVREQQEIYTDVEFSVETPSELMVEDVDPATLHLAVQNLIENGVEHNDSESPSITASVEERENETRVQIADNGPGIPEIEQEAVGAKRETPLGHSQGLGLWLTYWCATRWGGDLRFETNEAGTTVTLTIPNETNSIAADPSETGHAIF